MTALLLAVGHGLRDAAALAAEETPDAAALAALLPEILGDAIAMPVEHGAMPLREYVDTVFGRERKRERPDTWKREVWHWNTHLTPALGATPLRALDKVMFDRFIQELRNKNGKPASGNTKRLVRAAYQACLTFAERNGHLDEIHKFYAIKGSTERALAAPVPLSGEETGALLANAPSLMHRALFAFAFEEGPRPSEVCWIDWSDVDWKADRVHVRGKKTNKSDRVIPLLPLTRRHLLEHWMAEGQPKTGPAFTWRGKPYTATTAFRSALKTAARKAEIADGRRIFPYLARHTALTTASANGAARDHVAAFAGHTNPRMVETTYDHTTAADRIDATRFGFRT